MKVADEFIKLSL